MSRGRRNGEPLNKLSLKFLVSNGLAGSFIGTGGSAIKELIEITDAKVTVSSLSDVYPGTNERIILISAIPSSVDQAQALVWDMLASNTKSNGDKSISWSPKASAQSLSDNADISLSGKITIAAAAGGLILGKNGSTLRSISEESGARVQMTTKDEAIFTQERVLTITGTTASCSKCVSMIIAKLSEDMELAQYMNRGVTYSNQILPMMGGGMGMGMPDPRGGRGGRGQAMNQGGMDVDATTTITISVPDELVGNILGRQVITRLSYENSTEMLYLRDL
jgi:RNA-binding protein Nova